MTFDELLNLNEYAHAKILAGHEKHNQRIENLYMADDKNFMDRVSHGDLVFLSACCFELLEKSLRDVIGCLSEKGAAGMLIGMGCDLERIDTDTIAYSEELGFPLIMMESEKTLSQILSTTYFELFRTQEKVKKADVFMRELLFGEEATALRYLSQYNYVGSRQHIVMFLGFDLPETDISRLEELASAVPINLSLQLFSVYYADVDGVIVVLELSQREPLDHVVNRILSAVQNSLNSVLNGNTISVGVSSIFYESKRMKACIDEARKAFQVLRGCGMRHATRYYEEIGVYRFFYEFNNDNELNDYVMEIMGELIQYDEDNQSNYVNTLQVYLEEGRNIGNTAERLFVHRNTITYRITKITEILDVDLENTNVIFNLQFAFRVRQYLDGKMTAFVNGKQK